MSIKVHKFVDKQSVFYANYYKFDSDLQPLSLFGNLCVNRIFILHCKIYSFILCFWKLYHRQTDKNDFLV
jgi:hypothetical protein